MKQASKNEADMLGLINKIQDQLNALDRKIDTLINRSIPEIKPTPKPVINNPPQRAMHTAICADCKKECTIPFKPSGDRPVYCKDCFSRRKVISMSGMKVTAPVPVDTPKEPVKNKNVTAKKAVSKKKPTPKKK